MNNHIYRRLTSLRQIHSQNEIQQPLLSQKLETIQLCQTKSHQLKNRIAKIKAQILVKQFIKKLKRNLVTSKPVQLRSQLQFQSNKDQEEYYCRGIGVDEGLRASFMIIDTIAILTIQILSSFQTLFAEYRELYIRSDWIFSLKSLILMIFLLKIVLGMVSLKTIRGVMISNIRILCYQYIKSSIFFFDFGILVTTILTTALPTSAIAGGVSFVMCIVSIPVILKNIEIIQNYFITNVKKRLYSDLLKIVLFDLFFAHLISTILFAISIHDSKSNWRIDQEIQDQDWSVQYLNAYYWGVTIITTVGFGDILPANSFQTIFVIFIQLFGCLILSYNISEVGRIIGTLRQINMQRQNDLATFKRMAKDDNISSQLQQSIINYIDQMSEMKNELQFLQRRQLLDKLPEEMRQMYRHETSSKIFSKLPFFKFMGQDTLIGFSEKINGKIFYPKSHIIDGNKGLNHILIIRSGQFSYVYNKKGSTINGSVVQSRIVDKNDNQPYLLNKYLLVPGKQINYDIIAKKYCFTYSISMEDFYEVLRDHTHDNQFFFSLLHKNFLIETECENQPCKYCPQDRHNLFDCHKMHYIPYNNLIISKHICVVSKAQQRNNLKQKRVKAQITKKNALYMWNKLFRKYQQAWYIKSKKDITERIIQCNKNRDQDSEHSNNMIEEIGYKILNEHCCSLKQQLTGFGEELQVDRLYNFSGYFPQYNSSYLNNLNLKKQTQKIKSKKIRSGLIRQ